MAGEKLFVDFAGNTIPVVNPKTGEVTFAKIFDAVIAASNYTFVTACESQKIDNWLAAHVQAFHSFGGVLELLIPDNLKSAATRYHSYESKPNERNYQVARHSGITIIPSRAGKPKDKPKVKNQQGTVQRGGRHHQNQDRQENIQDTLNSQRDTAGT